MDLEVELEVELDEERAQMKSLQEDDAIYLSFKIRH